MPVFEPPRTMAGFLAASRGTWLNRRSIHHLDRTMRLRTPIWSSNLSTPTILW